MRSPLLLASLVLLAACGGSADSTTAPGTGTGTGTPPVPTVTTSVNLSGNTFSPSAIQVSPGAVVTWTNSDSYNHNVTFASTDVGTVANFATGSRTLTMPAAVGTYTYHCTIHAGMNGTVEVK